MEHVTANGVEFAYLTEGPADGPLALCLHGFPDTAHTWRYLLPALAGAGYRAVAPWLRGYHPTAIPADGRYQTGALALDAIGLHEALGGDERAVIVGHDWGATATYAAAAHEPDRWSKVVTMAVPPLAVAGAALTSYDQIKRSFYMFVFQLPMAESLVAAGDLEFIARLWGDWSPGYDAREDLAHVRASLGSAEHLTAALGYYRAMFQPDRRDPDLAAVDGAAFAPTPQPTLYLHGADDGCYRADLTQVPAHLGPGSKVAEVPGAGHFLHVEKPDEVNRLVLDFLAG